MPAFVIATELQQALRRHGEGRGGERADSECRHGAGLSQSGDKLMSKVSGVRRGLSFALLSLVLYVLAQCSPL
jgi:hypothetical protein